MSNEEAFVNELIGYIFAYPDDDYMTMECLCRKLHKYGLIDKKDGEWTCGFIEQADTPQTDCNADQHVQHVEYVENNERSRCWNCEHFESMYETPISSDGTHYSYVTCNASECRYEPKTEPQTERSE